MLLEPQRDFVRERDILELISLTPFLSGRFKCWFKGAMPSNHNWMDDEAITFRLCLVFMIILLTTK